MNKNLNSCTKLINKNWIFLLTLVFNLSLLLNPSNKAVILSSFLLFFVFLYKFKSSTLGLIACYLSTLTIFTGKAFEIQLIPKELLLTSSSYVIYLIISSQWILGLLLALHFFLNIHKLRTQILRNKIILIYIFFLFISSLISRFPGISLFFILNYLGIVSLYFLATGNLINKKIVKNILIQVLVALGIFQSIVSSLQFIKQSNLGSPVEVVNLISPQVETESNPYLSRVVGTFSHPNELAFFILPILLYLTTLAFGGFTAISGKRGTFLLISFLLFTLILTQSRSALFIFIVLFTMKLIFLRKIYKLDFDRYYYKNLSRFLIVLLPVLFIALFPRISDTLKTFYPEGSATSRLIQIRESLSVVSQKPLFGTGLGQGVLETFIINPDGLIANSPAPPHLIYLHLLLESGVIATSFFFFFISKKVILLTRKICKKSGADQQIVLLGYFFAILSILLNGFFQPIMEATFKPLMIFLILAEL